MRVLAFGFLVLLSIVSACKKEQVPRDIAGPLLKFQSDDDFKNDPGRIIRYKLVASDISEIKKVTIFMDHPDGKTEKVIDTLIPPGSTTVNITRTFTVPENSYGYTFKL